MSLNIDHRTMLIVPDSLPDPSHEDWPDLAARSFADVVQTVRGRTLALFSSSQSIELAWRYARHCRLNVLREGDASPADLLAAFYTDTSSVLMGTDSFWERLAFPGEACSCVVLDRLPFPRPDDPVLAALRAQDAHWFLHYGLPHAVSAFGRALGGLPRRLEHRVVIVVLDPRLLTRPYGGLFLQALPGVPIRRSLQDLRPFLEADESMRLEHENSSALIREREERASVATPSPAQPKSARVLNLPVLAGSPPTAQHLAPRRVPRTPASRKAGNS